MLKWILGALALIVIAVGGTCFYGYRQLTSGGDTITMTMAATPERLFASLATPDSMALWLSSSEVLGPFGKGVLAVGDTLRFKGTGRGADSTAGVRVSGDWVVREVGAPYLLVMEMRADSAGRRQVILMRRDSLVAAGDSTTLITSFNAPLLDSLQVATRDSSKVGSSILGGATKMMIGAMRLGTEQELQRLKARVEGRAMPEQE